MSDNIPVESSVVKQLRSSGFLVTALESHNDIVTAVDCDDSLIISARYPYLCQKPYAKQIFIFSFITLL